MANTAKKGVVGNIKLSGYDALFGTSVAAEGREQIIEVPLGELHDFKDHPLITKYFTEDYSNEEIEKVILNLLERWKGEMSWWAI